MGEGGPEGHVSGSPTPGGRGLEVPFDASFARRLEALTLVARRIHAGRMRAERRSRRTGSGMSFADHRPYVPGDDFRSVDFAVFQRTRKLLVRLYEEEEDLSVHLLLDASGSMGLGGPTKLELARRLVAAFAYVGLARLDRVSIAILRDAVDGRLPPLRGKRQILRVLEFLGALEARGRTDLDTAVRAFVAETRRRGLVVLVSDFYDVANAASAIDRLRHAGFETHVVHLVDRDELDPDLVGDLRLEDAETGEVLDVTITPELLARHRKALLASRELLARHCREKRVAHHTVDVHAPLEDAVLGLLVKEGLFG